ncbi:MAG: murein biosynthesis integral membrane protein MurJ [Bdellovibrio sp.]|nr:MAG: murein biosynthesis integral membrane protein MurJ [Bdellovibrio sp.]
MTSIEPQVKRRVTQTEGASGPVAVQALIMAFGTMTSRLLGLAREILFASLFPRLITDSWYAAFRIPNVFRRLFGEGSLSVSFIPVFVDAHRDSHARAQNLVNSFYTLFLLLLATFTALGIFYAEPLFRLLLDREFIEVPGKFELAVRMGRIMFAYIFLVCTYAYEMAILNALGRFGWAAMAPTFFNLVMVAATLLPPHILAWDGQALAWGVIAGGVVQAAVLLPSLIRLGYLPRFRFDWNNSDMWMVFRTMGPGLVGMSILQVTTLVNMVFATSLGEGSLSYLNLADRLMELPLSLVSVSIGSALLPTLARLHAEKKEAQATTTMDQYFRLNLFMSFPAAVGLFALAHPIVELLFERGRFHPHETLIVADVIRVYAVNLIFISVTRVFVQSFYSIKNTWIPALASILGLVLHISMARLLMSWWGLRGLNISSLASVMLNFSCLVVAYRFLIGQFPWHHSFRSLIRWIPSLIGLFATLQIYEVARRFLGDHFLAKCVSLFGIIGLGIGVYGLLCHFLRVSEFEYVFRTFRRKLEQKGILAKD